MDKNRVGERGFEPPTSTSRTWRAPRLRYSPMIDIKKGQCNVRFCAARIKELEGAMR